MSRHLELVTPAPETEKPAARIDIDRVLEIAADQFAEHGFDGISMREVSRECGCPVASIYYHFTSKTELYTEAYSHKIEQTIDLMKSRLDAVRDPHQRFRTLVEAFYDLFTGDHSLILLMQRDVIDASVNRRRFLSLRQYDHFIALIRSIGREMLGAAVSRETATTVGSLIFGFCELSPVAQEVYDQHGPDLVRAERDRLVRAATALLSVA